MGKLPYITLRLLQEGAVPNAEQTRQQHLEASGNKGFWQQPGSRQEVGLLLLWSLLRYIRFLRNMGECLYVVSNVGALNYTRVQIGLRVRRVNGLLYYRDLKV